jgi:probable rRNA maturation factor
MPGERGADRGGETGAESGSASCCVAQAPAIDVQVATTGETPSEEDIRRWAWAVLGAVSVRDGGPGPAGPGELCVRLVDEAESAALNGQYRHRPGPTNVLSFPAEVDLPDLRAWGDIVICMPLVQAEASAQGKTFEAHFAHLVVHGVLHLLGYDHQSAAEAEQMETLEKRILGRFGVADPYGEG